MLHSNESSQGDDTQTRCGRHEMATMAGARRPLDQCVRDAAQSQRRQKSAKPIKVKAAAKPTTQSAPKAAKPKASGKAKSPKATSKKEKA